jgi:hypothetical protein
MNNNKKNAKNAKADQVPEETKVTAKAQGKSKSPAPNNKKSPRKPIESAPEQL